MPQPKALAFVGVCPFCHESYERVFPRKIVKQIRKSFKGRSTSDVLRFKDTCPRCGETIRPEITKKQAKAMWDGMKKNNINEADITANLGMEKMK